MMRNYDPLNRLLERADAKMKELKLKDHPPDPHPTSEDRDESLTIAASEPPTITPGVVDDIAAERRAQDSQWGGPANDDQHPDGTGPGEILVGAAGEDKINARWTFHPQLQEFITKERFSTGGGAWSDVLAEAVAKALAEDDPAQLRRRLVQMTAVGVAWIEAIDRRET